MKKGLFVLAALFPVWLIMPGRASVGQKAPYMRRNFAHRGLHKKDQSVPENSLRAFDLAATAGYGIELDVQLSLDGKVVVFHDDDLNRICGVDKGVDELLYEDLAKLPLAGSEIDHMPLFTEVLNVVNGRVPIIVELKSGKRNKELCQKTYKILQAYKGDACVESFNPMIVAWFRVHAPELFRGQLTMPPANYLKSTPLQRFLIGNVAMNVLARPHFIAHQVADKAPGVKLAEKLGAVKICWTSHDMSNETKNDAVIFEYYKPTKKF